MTNGKDDTAGLRSAANRLLAEAEVQAAEEGFSSPTAHSQFEQLCSIWKKTGREARDRFVYAKVMPELADVMQRNWDREIPGKGRNSRNANR